MTDDTTDAVGVAREEKTRDRILRGYKMFPNALEVTGLIDDAIKRIDDLEAYIKKLEAKLAAVTRERDAQKRAINAVRVYAERPWHPTPDANISRKAYDQVTEALRVALAFAEQPPQTGDLTGRDG